MIKANQRRTADVWIYFSPPAQNTLPVANKAAPGKYSCGFLKGRKLNNMDIRGLRVSQTLDCRCKPKRFSAVCRGMQHISSGTQRGILVTNHTAECGWQHQPATIIFILHWKIFLLCSTWGMASGSSLFTAPKWYKSTINLGTVSFRVQLLFW